MPSSRISWHQATFLSREQQRRRDTGSALPHEYYSLAVHRHSLTDPTNKEAIPCRVIFVSSSADAAECRQRRQKNIVKIQTGFEALAAKLQRGHPCTTAASIQRQVARLLGRRDAARYFHWELIPLTAEEQAALRTPVAATINRLLPTTDTARCFHWELIPLTTEEQAALPPPRKGFRRPTHRLMFNFDPTAAETDARYDGLSALVTTVAPLTTIADVLFTQQFKEQNYLERDHHQSGRRHWRFEPVFLKSTTSRGSIGLSAAPTLAYKVHQLWNDSTASRVPADCHAQRTTVYPCQNQLLRDFKQCGIRIDRTAIGPVMLRSRRQSPRQQQILRRLGLPSPTQTWARALPPVPTG